MTDYKIRSFNKELGQILVQFDDLPLVAIDLQVDENGNVPEGEDLDNAIRVFYPSWHFDRLERLKNGIRNADQVEKLVDPIPVIEPSLDDLAFEARAVRKAMLDQSDWSQFPDNGLSEEQRALWVAYRQALRDISLQPEFPSNIDWPTAP